MKSKPTVLDTFSGAGGFSLGFEQAGCDIVGAIEIDQWAADTFSFNHPDAQVFVGDMQKFSSTHLRSKLKKVPDIVLGGPPCQGFSICRKNAGDPKDPRNSLFKEFIRIAKDFEPQVLVMENVPNLAKAETQQKIRVISLIEDELRALGYHVYTEILNAPSFGVPQIRKRLFAIASKMPLESPFPRPTHFLTNGNQALPFEENLKPCPTLWEAISDLPVLEAGEGAEEQAYEQSPKTEFQMQMRNGCSVLLNHKAMNHSKRMVERFSNMKWGQSGKDAPMHLRPRERNTNVISSKVYDQNNRRMHPDRPCHTIPASFYANFVHPYSNRNFTAREGARIQSFPDNFKFLGKPTTVSHKLLQREGRISEKHLCQYNQVGNAVPPVLARAIAKHILSQIFGMET